jgi:hypothetical protein
MIVHVKRSQMPNWCCHRNKNSSKLLLLWAQPYSYLTIVRLTPPQQFNLNCIVDVTGLSTSLKTRIYYTCGRQVLKRGIM